MKLFFKNDLIEFYCAEEKYEVIHPPVPAHKLMPEWFKKIKPKTEAGRDQYGAKAATAKKCMPLLDAMSVGFIIPMFATTNVRTNDTGEFIEIGPPGPFGESIQFHSVEQLGGRTSPTYPGPAIKFINHWIIKTAPGYSTLFIPPINHIEPRFTCLSGLVDTDKYLKEVNFPAIWHAKNYDDVIEAGTPLVTVIPVKRSDLEAECKTRKATEAELKYMDNLTKRQGLQAGVYTKELREPR
jgi:hypothetical protein